MTVLVASGRVPASWGKGLVSRLAMELERERETKTRFITNTGVIIQGGRERERGVADEDAEEDGELVGFDC